jgi:hypothetical protein
MVRVLERDRNGRETLWQCSECARPFTSGWGSKCNACIAVAERHAELLRAIFNDTTGKEYPSAPSHS